MPKTKDHVAGIAIQIPDDMIQNVILAEVAKTIGGIEGVIEAVVREVVCYKKSTYDQDTVFDTQVKEMIRNACKETFVAWLAENKEAIKKALLVQLNKGKQRKLKEIVEQLSSDMADLRIYGIKVHVPGADS